MLTLCLCPLLPPPPVDEIGIDKIAIVNQLLYFFLRLLSLLKRDSYSKDDNDLLTGRWMGRLSPVFLELYSHTWYCLDDL